MILHTNEEYRVVNSPSDGDLRKVYNSIQIIVKPNNPQAN